MENVNKQLLDAAKLVLQQAGRNLAAINLPVLEKLTAAIAAAEQAQQAEPVDQQRAGVYRKFNVSRTDGRDLPGGDRHGAQYFVLDVTHDKFAKPALAAYAAACRNDYPALADDMVRRYGIDQQQAEPVAWQYRARLANGSVYGDWHGCSKQVHDRYKSGEFNGDLQFDTRALYARPPAVAVPDERAAFEAWLQKNIDDTDTVRPSKEKVDAYFAVWLARAMLAAEQKNGVA